MRLGKFLIWVAVFLVFVYVLFPENFNDGREWVEDKIGIGEDKIKTASTNESPDFDRGSSNPVPYPNSTNSNLEELDEDDDGDYDQEDYEKTVYGDAYKDYGYYGEHGYPAENKCGYETYGYPDYLGTEKDGKTCADALTSRVDIECLENPPYNYDGDIHLRQKLSDPILECCILDGTCHWS